MEKMIKYNCTYDLVFKNVFKDEEILKDFLEAILGKKYNLHGIKYLNVEDNNSLIYKSSTYDIKLAIIDNENVLKENIILEMQRNKPNYDIKRRISYYHHKLGTYSQLKGNADYKSINTISIFILNFNIYDDNICMKEFPSNEATHPNIKLSDDNVVIIELKKINDLKNGKLKKWLEIITANNLEGLKGESKIMDKAIDMIETINRNKAFLEILEEEDKKEKK